MSAVDRPGAERWVPEGVDIEQLRGAAQECRGCELWRDATQAVFGEGSRGARIMLVGEQPGDREDREGEPFVGPAGRLLDETLEEAGIPREDAYVTNAVKHFRFEPRGKRRLHARPQVGHIDACRPWLDAELRAVRPTTVICLGATAARGVLRRTVRVGEERGTVQRLDEYSVMVTIHPSAILRIRDADERAAARAEFVADLRRAAEAAATR